MSDTLPHAVDDCTGEWEQIGKRGSGTWRCSVCSAEHPSTPENDRAADREYAYGALLRNQVRKRLLDELPRPRPLIWIDLSDEGDDDEGYDDGAEAGGRPAQESDA